MRSLYCFSALSLCCALLATKPVYAQTYSIQDLGIPPQTAFSEAFGINQSGQVLGFAGNYLGPLLIGQPFYFFVYSDGKILKLDFDALGIAGGASKDPWEEQGKGELRVTGQEVTPAGVITVLYENHFVHDIDVPPGYGQTAGYAVNSSGEVVGSLAPGKGLVQAFLYKNGKILKLGTLPGGTGSEAHGINDEGDVTGFAVAANGEQHAFLYRNGKMSDIGTAPAAISSQGLAINDVDQVTGYAFFAASTQFHAFLWSKGIMTDLGVLPAGNQSQGNGINSWGQVVGTSNLPWPAFPGDYLDHGFLYSNGKLHDLNDLIPPNSGWTISDAAGINDRGEIAGTGLINGEIHAVLLKLDCNDRRNHDCEPCRYGHW